MGHAESAGSAAAAAAAGKEEEVRLVSVSFNQDNTCFAAATTADMRVFTCHPFGETVRRVHAAGGGGGFAVAEMLFRTNIFAVVAGDLTTKVEVWDDSRGARHGEHRFSSAVRAVRVSRDHLAVALDRVVRVYDLWSPAAPPLRKIPTCHNPRGLCCLSCHAGDAPPVLACPGTARGQVRVESLGKETTTAATTRLIAAHGSDVACMALAVDGTVLATASVKGTLVRVFSTVDGTCLQEVRRGRDSAEIYSIALSRKLQWLAVSSDRGTLHVFRLRVRAGGNDAGDTASNPRSSLSFVKGILPNYFSSEWSFAQFHLPEVTRFVVAFGGQNTVMIIGMDGSFCRCSFDPANGGEMVRKEYYRFLNDKNTPSIKTLTT